MILALLLAPCLGSSIEAPHLPFFRAIWSEKYKYVACVVGGCGSDRWTRQMLASHLLEQDLLELQSDESVFQHTEVDFAKWSLFHRIPPSRIYHSQEYFRFAVVCHPWRRLIEAYRDTYLLVCHADRDCFQRLFVRSIAVDRSSPLTLLELIQSLLEDRQSSAEASQVFRNVNNKHFASISSQCGVGALPYDYIGNIDSSEDMAHILSKINTSVPLPLMQDDKSSVSLMCDSETVEAANALFADDLTTFNFSMSVVSRACSPKGLTSDVEFGFDQ
jgi:hypothetical protein